MTTAAKKLKRANVLLDHACDLASLDPTEVRVAMAKVIRDGLEAQETAQAEDAPMVNGHA